MTQRMPRGVTFESWTEKQIREAQERGSFDGLPGTGKPLPRRRQGDALDWVADKVRREDLPVTAVLPPALALAKEVEDLPVRLARERSEARVRSLVEDLDERVRRARVAPQVGPPVRTRPLDVDAVVAAWRADREAREPAAAPARPVEQPSARDSRRWWRRR